MLWIYRIFAGAYFAFIRIAAINSLKAKKWVEGRRTQAGEWRKIDAEGSRLLWMHAASLGEFEQGRPVLEEFRKRHPDWKVLVTFFSPSGYEIRKEYDQADYIFYLPEDTSENVREFLDTFNPTIAMFVKYEFWYGYLEGMERRNIPLVFISAIFRKNQVFFKWYGKWFLNRLRVAAHIFVQDRHSLALIRSKGLTNVSLGGDTRYDRVLQTVSDSRHFPEVEEFLGGSRVLIFGSAWQKETKLFRAFEAALPPGWKIIYAPHEIHRERLEKLAEDTVHGAVLFSTLGSAMKKEANTLIVDGVGYLAALYKYADIALIGGGFGSGIHNILEPAAFGCPVLFGPNHSKFPEAGEMIKSGCGFEIRDENDFGKVFDRVSDDSELQRLKKQTAQFVKERAGATSKIMKLLDKLAQIIYCQTS